MDLLNGCERHDEQGHGIEAPFPVGNRRGGQSRPGHTLLCFPAGLTGLLGLLPTNTYFYASILGAVIFGIGAALAIELYGALGGLHGVSLGGVAVAGRLLFVPLKIPVRGYIVLWCVALLVLGMGVDELATRSWAPQ